MVSFVPLSWLKLLSVIWFDYRTSIGKTWPKQNFHWSNHCCWLPSPVSRHDYGWIPNIAASLAIISPASTNHKPTLLVGKNDAYMVGYVGYVSYMGIIQVIVGGNHIQLHGSYLSMVVSTANPEPKSTVNFAARATVDPRDSGRSFHQSPRQTTEGMQRCHASWCRNKVFGLITGGNAEWQHKLP